MAARSTQIEITLEVPSQAVYLETASQQLPVARTRLSLNPNLGLEEEDRDRGSVPHQSRPRRRGCTKTCHGYASMSIPHEGKGEEEEKDLVRLGTLILNSLQIGLTARTHS